MQTNTALNYAALTGVHATKNRTTTIFLPIVTISLPKSINTFTAVINSYILLLDYAAGQQYHCVALKRVLNLFDDIVASRNPG
jgi:hypothetical protein